jgi:hypothetical protein
MALQYRILKGIDDVKPVMSHSSAHTPLNNLIASYMKLAVHDDNLPNITQLTTGADFKAAISLLDAEILIDLLKAFVDEQRTVLHGWHPKESAEKVADRNLKHWLIKFGAFAFYTTFGGLIFAVYRSGAMDNGDVVKAIFSRAVDVAKLIFSISTK